MDKDFWAAIVRNDYQIPDGHTLNELTEALFSYLSSTDPDLRDEIAYFTYANLLERGMYSTAEVSAHIDQLLGNLTKSIGETESDSVFLRAFSILLLAEIVHNDNKKPVLEKPQVQLILTEGIRYLNAEKDPRGHVPVKGWAHALAHTADLMLELGKNRFIDQDDQERMLQAIMDKLVHAAKWLYIHGEDDRLARAAIEILRRDSIPLERVDAWLKSFLHPDGKDWKGIFVDEERIRAFHNTRNFLRSLFVKLLSNRENMPNHEQVVGILLGVLKNLGPY